MKKPRQDEPTGVDGGQIALAIGFGEKSSMSSSPRCKRLHLGVAGCRSLSFKRELPNQRCESFETQTKSTPGRKKNQASAPAFTMKILNHISAMDTRPLCRGFCHAGGSFGVTGGKGIATRAQAPPLLACALGKSANSAKHQALYTDLLF
jgi:hypothetical protein